MYLRTASKAVAVFLHGQHGHGDRVVLLGRCEEVRMQHPCTRSYNGDSTTTYRQKGLPGPGVGLVMCARESSVQMPAPAPALASCMGMAMVLTKSEGGKRVAGCMPVMRGGGKMAAGLAHALCVVRDGERERKKKRVVYTVQTIESLGKCFEVCRR